MKISKLLWLFAFISPLVYGCSQSQNESDEQNTTEKKTENNPKSNSGKVTIPAHTLKDSYPPITVGANGEQVTEETWDSYRYTTIAKYNGMYNFTYRAYSGGSYTVEKFTKNGYYLQSTGGSSYYERASASTFYSYTNTNEGYLRQEITFDLQTRYTSRVQNEIYVHMFDFSNYEYDSFDGCYRYYATGFTAAAKFQSGYLTYLYYIIGSNFFEISLAFETEIEIPISYYYNK